MKKYWHKLELIIDKLIPPCLVLLLGIIIIDIFYMDFAHDHYFWILITDSFIVLVFLIDLIFKYIRIKNVPLFLRRYWIDILAVFPFYLLFRGVELILAFMPVSESMKSVQMMLHEGLEIEKEGSKIVKEAGKAGRFQRLARFIRPIVRAPRFLKIIPYFEKPTGRHHHYENHVKESNKKINKGINKNLNKNINKDIDKKAASPLVATVILFFFALLIGTLIVHFSSYIDHGNAVCNDIDNIDIAISKNNDLICQIDKGNSSLIRFNILNNEDKPIFGLHMTFIGNTSETPFIIRDYNTTIVPYGTASKSYSFPKSIGVLQNFKLSVYRKLGVELILCNEAVAVISSIPECE